MSLLLTSSSSNLQGEVETNNVEGQSMRRGSD